MPTLFHSRLQRNLANFINRHTAQFEAVQELRCLVPPYSPVPDISVVLCVGLCPVFDHRLPDEDDPLDGAPDWLIEIRALLKAGMNPPPSPQVWGNQTFKVPQTWGIEGAFQKDCASTIIPQFSNAEIRSPDQSTLDLQNKILHCLSNGTQIAWLIDLARQQVWVWQGDSLPLVCSGVDILPMLGILPELTVDALMAMTSRQ